MQGSEERLTVGMGRAGAIREKQENLLRKLARLCNVKLPEVKLYCEEYTDFTLFNTGVRHEIRYQRDPYMGEDETGNSEHTGEPLSFIEHVYLTLLPFPTIPVYSARWSRSHKPPPPLPRGLFNFRIEDRRSSIIFCKRIARLLIPPKATYAKMYRQHRLVYNTLPLLAIYSGTPPTSCNDIRLLGRGVTITPAEYKLAALLTITPFIRLKKDDSIVDHIIDVERAVTIKITSRLERTTCTPPCAGIAWLLFIPRSGGKITYKLEPVIYTEYGEKCSLIYPVLVFALISIILSSSKQAILDVTEGVETILREANSIRELLEKAEMLREKVMVQFDYKNIIERAEHLLNDIGLQECPINNSLANIVLQDAYRALQCKISSKTIYCPNIYALTTSLLREYVELLKSMPMTDQGRLVHIKRMLKHATTALWSLSRI